MVTSGSSSESGHPIQVLNDGQHSIHQASFLTSGGAMSLSPMVNVTNNVMIPKPDPVGHPQSSSTDSSRGKIEPRSPGSAKTGVWDRLKCRIAFMKPKSNPGSNPRGIVCSEGFIVTPAQDLDPETWEPNKPEVYIRSMLTSGKGLASWEPRPYDGERGTVPGDVGTFSAAGGFKKIFNLWEDTWGLVGDLQTPPKMNVLPRTRALSPHEPIMDGTSAETEYTTDGNISSVEFKMAAPRGAVLVSTSPADLEELDNYIKLRGFIIEHASSLYQSANTLRELDDDESLYIVTGCIKNASWAMAAFKDPMAPPHDVLKLVKGGGSGPIPIYLWTSRGTASAKSYPDELHRDYNAKEKNQTLFMHGFKLSFSSAFRSRWNNQPITRDAEDSNKPSKDSDFFDEGGNRDSPDDTNGGSSSKGSGGGGDFFSNGLKSSFGHALSDGPLIQSFPERHTEITVHPLDATNRRLLDLTKADFALTHDDDWRFALENKTLDDVDSFDPLRTKSISVCNGVAFLVDDKSQVQDLPVDGAANTTRVYRLNPSPHSQLVQNLKGDSQDDISPDLSRMDGPSKYPTGKTWKLAKPRRPGYKSNVEAERGRNSLGGAKPGRDDHSINLWTSPLRHPPDESAEERKERLLKEREAQVVSDAIDEEIEAERRAAKRIKPVKILLLGQSESGDLINGTEGKSTTLKNFQLMYEPKAFLLERASWRAVIQLNVVQSFRLILNAITRAQKALQSSPSASIDEIPQVPPELLKRKLKLTALLNVEGTLIRRLTPGGSGETKATQLARSNDDASEQDGGAGGPSGGGVGGKSPVVKELAVNSTNLWKDVFKRLQHGEDAIDCDDPEDPGRILHDLSEDMIKLWNDPITQVLLEKQNLRMQELGGFFLDQLERVTAPRYVPTDDDILKARLKTLGVTEHRFTFSSNRTGQLSRDWRVFDVGGHRSLRAAWVPYFDDMDAIIFLAPISCFDQTLSEDPKVNRLADSVCLWTEVASNPLLKRTNLILFLNKIDIFRMKLEAGIRFSDHIVSYSKANDFDSTTTYLQKKFANILQDKSPIPRAFYCHLTTVTNPKSTKYILANLKEMLMVSKLANIPLV